MKWLSHVLGYISSNVDVVKLVALIFRVRLTFSHPPVLRAAGRPMCGAGGESLSTLQPTHWNISRSPMYHTDTELRGEDMHSRTMLTIFLKVIAVYLFLLHICKITLNCRLTYMSHSGTACIIPFVAFQPELLIFYSNCKESFPYIFAL